MAARHRGVAICAVDRRGLAELIDRAQGMLFAETEEPVHITGAVGSGGAS